MEKSFGRYFQSSTNLESCYTRTNFESTAFAGFEKWNKSYVGRVRNALIKAINDNGCMMPKYIIMLLDNEMIKSVSYRGFGFSDIIHRIYSWLATQVDRAIRSVKDIIPAKSRRKYKLQVIWQAVPEHKNLADNYKRARTNEIIAEVLGEIPRHEDGMTN